MSFENVALWTGYAVIGAIAVGIVGTVAVVHWHMFVCVLSYTKLTRHYGNKILRHPKRFPAIWMFFHALSRMWLMPIESTRVGGSICASDWSFYPGWWPEVWVDGKRI